MGECAHGRTVLIVDDDDDMQYYFGFVLRDMGLNLLKAGNGQEALEVIDAHREIDLILLDIVMPVMNGEEFFKVLRTERRSEIPVIACSVDETRAQNLRSIGRLEGVFLKGRQKEELRRLVAGTGVPS